MIEQSHMLTELEKHAGWDVLVDYLKVFAGAQQRRLLNGKIESLEEYKHISGELVGIDRALKAPAIVRGMVEAERLRREAAGVPQT